MTKALAWIRKSKGAEDDIGLEEQRRRVAELASDVAEDVDTIDLGVYTGFTIHTREPDEPRLDNHDDVQTTVEDLRSGKYDYLAALDDMRICRDEYIYEIERAAKIGNCEFIFVLDVERDDLTYGVRRTVEREVKKEEIRKSRRAWQQWSDQADWEGPPPMGLQYTDDGRSLEPDSEFESVMRVFDLLDDYTYAEIAEKTGISTSAITKVKERGREFYLQFESTPA